jgi:hypothetical protein
MKHLLFILFFFCLTEMARAQAPVVAKSEYMNISVVESLVAGGLGRSRMMITDENGKTQEVNIANFFSLGGINFSNIAENDTKVTLKIKDLADKGWEISQVTAGATETIFITRYLLRRNKQ